MSDAGKAVFLSYASQDAEAARKICEALRAGGVEVWFDQSELIGGDAWDQKIRRQIKECALLIPVISQNTQARSEGYFRLEWRLADQRTHLMAKGRPFLLPVVTDDTRDAEAHVPDSFTEVQWTRLPAGETPPAFSARVQKLLADPVVEPARPRPAAIVAVAATNGPKWLKPILASAVIVIVVLAGTLIRNASQPGSEKRPSSAPSPESAEVTRIRARIIPDHWQKGDFEALSPAIDRLIQNNPENAEAWALRSIINSLQVVRLIDPGTQPLETGKLAAERALRSGADSPLGHLAFGLHLVAMVSRGGDPAASRSQIDGAVAALPPDTLTRYAELVSFWLGYDFAGTERSARAWLHAEPMASFPAWIMVGECLATRRADEAEKWAAGSINDPDITGIRTLVNLAEINFYLRADPVRSRAALDRVPPPSRSIARVVYARWLQAMVEGEADLALQELSRVPDPMLRDLAYNGPKALLAGLAHQQAGRREAALTQFNEAERLLREALATDPENEAFRTVLAVALANAGRVPEARRELALVEPLVRGRAPNVYRARLILALMQAQAALGDSAALVPWLRKLFTEPSNMPYTPASFRLDPRFQSVSGAPVIQALLQEFAYLDQPANSPREGGRK